MMLLRQSVLPRHKYLHMKPLLENEALHGDY
jgi:hypothetical protein